MVGAVVVADRSTMPMTAMTAQTHLRHISTPILHLRQCLSAAEVHQRQAPTALRLPDRQGTIMLVQLRKEVAISEDHLLCQHIVEAPHHHLREATTVGPRRMGIRIITEMARVGNTKAKIMGQDSLLVYDEFDGLRHHTNQFWNEWRCPVFSIAKYWLSCRYII